MFFNILGTGSISFNEFAKAFISKNKKGASIERVKEVFLQSDLDRNGFLSTEECYIALRSLGHDMNDAGLKRIMQLADKNKDGRVSFMGMMIYSKKIHCIFL